MSNKTAREALEYALDVEMVCLYAALVAGFVLMIFGFKSIMWIYGPVGSALLKGIATIITLTGGILLQFGGIVGILYKVISDATGQE